MIRDSATVESDTTIQKDVCIIGAGAAGITMALELEGSGRSVCVLESGGFHVETETQQLAAGRPPIGLLREHADYLATSRLRVLGGTTHHWTGNCRPLDAIDFEQRGWVPNSGWPFGPNELVPFYQRATKLLQIQPFDYSLQDLARKPLDLDPAAGIVTTVYHRSPPTRFGLTYREPLAASRNVEVLLHANVVNLQTDEAASRIEWVDVASLAGKRFRVRARCTVLAAGGLENARLLLSSNRVHSAGIGNQNDLVGRYFMEHIYRGFGIGTVFFAEPARALRLYTRESPGGFLKHHHRGVFSLSEDLQRRHRLLNYQFGIVPDQEPLPPPTLGGAVASLVGDLARADRRKAPAGSHFARFKLGAELSPDAENRVVLGDEIDALGTRRLKLRYRLTPFDKESIRRAVLVFATMLGRAFAGRVQLETDLDDPWDWTVPGMHHMGTTRMHADEKRGVVDPDCRVHGLSNLYIAGSSVFPTAGRPNPTFTLVALAIRLSDHIKTVLA